LNLLFRFSRGPTVGIIYGGGDFHDYPMSEKTAAEIRPPIAIARKMALVIRSDFFIS
jgi:hypothetical protein